jgi:type IV secretion system protein VirB1
MSGHSAPLPKQTFEAIADRCAPTVSASVLKAVAAAETRFNPLALRNNTTKLFISPPSLAAAVQQAKQWISQGNSVDLGLMQINSNNLSALGMTVEAALDPCTSLAGAAHILSAAYDQGSSAADRQAALLIALSRYNTGRSLAGLTNGYVGRVLAAQNDEAQTISKTPSNAKPRLGWDIWAIASAAQSDGAPWLIGSQATPEFLIGAGANSTAGELHALSEGSQTAPKQ